MQDRHESTGVSEQEVMGPAWSPAQIVALVFGVFYLILGALALARGGVSADGFTSTHVNVMGFDHTPLLGVIELVFGLLMIMAGAVPGAGRGTMAFLGTLALGFGVVILAVSASLYDALGVHEANGWLCLITGVITLVAAIAAPIIFSRSRHTVAYDHDVAHSARN
jgi:Domain of unknown function (DUF4383)